MSVHNIWNTRNINELAVLWVGTEILKTKWIQVGNQIIVDEVHLRLKSKEAVKTQEVKTLVNNKTY